MTVSLPEDLRAALDAPNFAHLTTLDPDGFPPASAMWVARAGDAIVFAMANPTPEVMPELIPTNVSVVATGRSDFPNQINNVLVFPGVFRGMLDVNATSCTIEMKRAAADALAGMVVQPDPSRVIPGVFEPGVAEAVADAVRSTAVELGHVRS